MFWRERERGVRQAGGNPRKFVCHRAHGHNFEWRVLKCLPLAAFGFAAAGEYRSAVQTPALAGMGWSSVVSKARINRAEENFPSRRIADSASHWMAAFHHRDGHTKFGKFSSARLI